MNLLGAPIEFPEVPFVTEIPGGARPGLLIRIQGKPSKHSHQFAFNVAAGYQITPPESDIGFHFNPRFSHNYVARNSLIGECWGNEEGSDPSDLPFSKNRDFECMIMVEDQHFKVAVDGVHFLTYAHRMPMERLHVFQLIGDVIVHKLEFLETRPIIPQPPMYGFQPTAPIGLQQPIEIVDLDIPFINQIPVPVIEGLHVRIHGKVPKRAREFMINFASGPRNYEPRSDIGFHFNPRFDCGYVARNTLVNQEWFAEESDEPNFLPFNRSEHFELSIMIEHHHYKVSVNGEHFLNYKHRFPIDRINTLQILGDIKVRKLVFVNNKHQPPAYGFPGQPMMGSGPQEIFNPIVPFRQVLHGGMPNGKSIFISGRPKPYATRFSINLERTREVEADIVFHFNPRFGGMGDESRSSIVRNDFVNGGWGNEERETNAFPFVQGFNFDLTITREEDVYLVAVNGQHLLSFRHRLPHLHADTLYIVGDVDIMLIRI